MATKKRRAVKKAKPRRNPLLGEAYSAGRSYADAKRRKVTPRYSGFEDWFRHAGKKVKDIAGFDKQDAKDLWTDGVNSVENRKNPAKKGRKSRKLTGAAKAAFLKRMAGGRKKAAKKNPSKSSKRKATIKRAKKVSRPRKAVRKTVRKRVNKGLRKPMGKARRRKNPEETAVEFYRKTHGRDPDVDVLVTETLQEHSSLAGVGRLEEMAIRTVTGETVDVWGFKGVVLASNEKGTQLFVKGGDQSVDLDDFDIEAKHEMQVLGQLVSVVYHTRKDHLTADTGGKGSYEHFFDKPRPTVIYDVRNKLLTIAGGAYVLKDVGVVR